MTNPKFYIKTLGGYSRLGSAPLAAGSGAVTFHGTGASPPSTLQLFFTGTNPLSGTSGSSPTITLGTAYTVTSTAGTYQFRIVNDITAPLFQIAVVSSGGVGSAGFNYYPGEEQGLRVKIYGQPDGNNKINIELQIEDNPGGLVLDKYESESADSSASKSLSAEADSDTWVLDAPSSLPKTWKIVLSETSNLQQGMNVEVLGGGTGDLDLDPPPP